MRKLASLVADDDVVSRRSMRIILEHFGHDVIEAESGPEALIALSSYRLDFAVLDIYMPGRGGLPTVRAYRALEKALRHDAIPIFGFTADVLGFNKNECISAGFSDVISKPIDLSSVRGLLRRYGLDRSIDAGGSEEIWR